MAQNGDNGFSSEIDEIEPNLNQTDPDAGRDE